MAVYIFDIKFKRVVLPLPLFPTKATVVLGSMIKEISCKTVVFAFFFSWFSFSLFIVFVRNCVLYEKLTLLNSIRPCVSDRVTAPNVSVLYCVWSNNSLIRCIHTCMVVFISNRSLTQITQSDK